MRQAGVVAAAALYAVDHNVERLAEDHENARWIAEQLSGIDELQVDYHAMQTNMVFVTVPDQHIAQLTDFLRQRSIVVTAGSPMRIVTHLDVDRHAAVALIKEIKAYFVS